MNRRQFGLYGTSSAAAAVVDSAVFSRARANAPARQAGLLSTTLTPFGAERAGNADGSIPAWTGGVTTIPAGWTPDQTLMPDIFAADKPLLTINAANMSQYSDMLSEGVMAMITQLGYRIDVYPTHRSASAPQYVYDNTAKNAATATCNPNGGRFGFADAFGGIPFPIPDQDENQGVQIVWNHLCRWLVFNFTRKISAFNVNQGQLNLGSTQIAKQQYPYYDPNSSLATFNGVLNKVHNSFVAPPPLYGQEIVSVSFTNPYATPNESWQLLPGQGRVRKAPELRYDTPAPGSSGFVNFDEIQAYIGSPVEYNWKFLGKKEFFIPYNSNGMSVASLDQLVQRHFLNPDFVRWEKHRVWVVEGTLAPGERNVVPRRRFYIDEDTWAIGIADEYDGQGNLWKCIINFNELRPDLPGLFFGGSTINDLQSDQYNIFSIPLNDLTYSSPLNFAILPAQTFNPEDMAAQAQY